ncbi:50S ribosomal protein L32, partial [uncultured Secundilactobacillus sp.]
MAVPARKTSKTKKRMRRGHIKLNTPNLSACPNCGELRKTHMVCPNCGFYDGRQVVQ